MVQAILLTAIQMVIVPARIAIAMVIPREGGVVLLETEWPNSRFP